jgi:uncharacterized protein (TIGR02217 family)
MAFFEVEFPRQISFSSTGGSAWNTTINEGFSGFEQRNRNWANSRAKFQIHLAGKAQTYFAQVYAFYLNVGGMADAFRFYWPLDCSATAQPIYTSTGLTNPVVQLVKTYTTGSRTYTRTIKKPITGSVTDFQGNTLPNTLKIYDNATLKTLTTHYTVDNATGLVSFLYTITTGNIITADFQFHYPVRFNVDDMTNAQILDSDLIDGKGLVTWSQVDLMEVRL